MTMSRPSHVHPSGLSPAEHDCYAPWMLELDGHLGHLGRGLRIGEMLGFIRKRTPVERESEVGSIVHVAAAAAAAAAADVVAICICILDHGLLRVDAAAAEPGRGRVHRDTPTGELDDEDGMA